MTLAELERAVARLGFVPSLEDGGELLRDAAGRALDEIAAFCPRLTSGSVWHLPSVPTYCEESCELQTGEKTISLPHGYSFFLRVSGGGRLTVHQGGEEREFPFSTGEGEPPALLGANLPSGRERVVFRFSGAAYRILTFAVYDTLFAERPPDPSGERRYDLATLFPSFGALSAPPRTKDGRTLCEGEGADYLLEDGHVLVLGPHTRGDIRISYRRRLSLPKEGLPLPLTDEEAALVPLFCAAYVLLDDDPEKAGFYLGRFHEGLARIRREGRAAHAYRDTNHWG